MWCVQAFALRFLADHNFDFNTLFSKGICYTKMSEMANTYDKCVFNVGGHDPHTRTFDCLSVAHQNQFDQVMVDIEEFVYDSKSERIKSFTVKSMSLKKAIFHKVNKVYAGTGVFFQYSKTSDEA